MGHAGDEILDRFQVKLFTEGSGTQIYSTTFAQWTAREVLRRAQAITLLVRFAPRQRQRPMNELLSSGNAHAELDPAGSLVDGDMAAYYHWINQQRLPGSDRSSFLVWFEGHSQALVVAPASPGNRVHVGSRPGTIIFAGRELSRLHGMTQAHSAAVEKALVGSL